MATTTTSSRLTDDAVATLAGAVRGGVVRPSDDGYEDARRLYNRMIDKHPGIIVRCLDAADVIATVNFAREQGLPLAVRGGGHNGAGLASCDGGVVADLSMMKGVRVDPENRTVRVAGGCTWGDVDHATHAFGMATPSGIISTTGVGGLTLGGGLGHLTRKCGLSIDNLLEADVVLADGRFVTTNKDQHPDLFWAIRGGGGNFGVVTSFVFRLHPIDSVIAGPMMWGMDKAEQILTWYRDYLPAAPDDLNGFFAFLTVPPSDPFPAELHLKKMCGVVWIWTGPHDQADAIFNPIRQMFGPPELDWVMPFTHPGLQGAFDGIYPPGDQWYWKADFFTELPDEAIALHVKHGAELPTWQSTMHLYPVDGAAGRVPRDATAWNYRNAKWGEVIVGVSKEPGDRDLITKWTRDYWTALHPYSAGGAYVNMMMDAEDEGQERVRQSYGDNYERLSRVKRQYDPGNLFRVNQNIKPA